MKLYRTSTPSSVRWVAAKTILSIIVVWSVALWILPVVIVRLTRTWWPDLFDFAPHRLLGVAVFMVGAAGGLWAATSMVKIGRGTPLPFDAAPVLVASGPYAIVRNPMAVAAILQSIGVGVGLGSWVIVAYSFWAGLMWHTMIRPSEEQFLRRLFGAEYGAYRARVGLWIPRARRKSN